jgi:hypothetical protein
MPQRTPRSPRWWLVLSLLVLLAGCKSGPAPRSRATEGPKLLPTGTAAVATIITPTEAVSATATPEALATPAPIAAPTRPALTLPALPDAFQFEVLLRPANAPSGPDTEIRGVYRSGTWQQSAHTRTSNGDSSAPAQEMVAFNGVTYTRPAGDPDWVRWPGSSFDAAYGMTSPFTALRLYAVADQKARGEAATLPGVTEPVFRLQAAISGSTVKRLLQAGAAALVADPEERATMVEQLAPLAVPQTITYWVTEKGRIYQATATLVTAGSDGQPAPWMQITWRFSGYDDPSIAVTAPMRYRDAPGPNAADQSQPTAAPAPALATDANLAVNVFASPGVAADNLAVTVYPAGDTRQPIDWRNDAKAQFALPPGRYDVLVQTNYAQEWLRGLEVTAGTRLNRDVTFDFGTLNITVQRDGKPVTADIVTYPAGNRQNWLDWRSDNPATIPLRAGMYDLEIAYDDYRGHQTVTGLQVKAGESTAQTINVR